MAIRQKIDPYKGRCVRSCKHFIPGDCVLREQPAICLKVSKSKDNDYLQNYELDEREKQVVIEWSNFQHIYIAITVSRLIKRQKEKNGIVGQLSCTVETERKDHQNILCTVIRSLIGTSAVQAVYDNDELVIIVDKVRTNIFTIVNDCNHTIGLGLYQLTSAINHDCNPNCMQSFDQVTGEISLRAIRPIQCDEEITVSYMDTGKPVWWRRNFLSTHYGFYCMCNRCCSDDDNHDDVLESILEDEGVKGEKDGNYMMSKKNNSVTADRITENPYLDQLLCSDNSCSGFCRLVSSETSVLSSSILNKRDGGGSNSSRNRTHKKDFSRQRPSESDIYHDWLRGELFNSTKNIPPRIKSASSSSPVVTASFATDNDDVSDNMNGNASNYEIESMLCSIPFPMGHVIVQTKFFCASGNNNNNIVSSNINASSNTRVDDTITGRGVVYRSSNKINDSSNYIKVNGNCSTAASLLTLTSNDILAISQEIEKSLEFVVKCTVCNKTRSLQDIIHCYQEVCQLLSNTDVSISKAKSSSPFSVSERLSNSVGNHQAAINILSTIVPSFHCSMTLLKMKLCEVLLAKYKYEKSLCVSNISSNRHMLIVNESWLSPLQEYFAHIRPLLSALSDLYSFSYNSSSSNNNDSSNNNNTMKNKLKLPSPQHITIIMLTLELADTIIELNSTFTNQNIQFENVQSRQQLEYMSNLRYAIELYERAFMSLKISHGLTHNLTTHVQNTLINLN